MTDKRMLIVDEETLGQIDENRGDMGRGEFIDFLIDSHAQERVTARGNAQYVSRKEYLEFTNEMKDRVRSFLDYFISNGLSKTGQSNGGHLTDLVAELESYFGSKGKARKSK